MIRLIFMFIAACFIFLIYMHLETYILEVVRVKLSKNPVGLKIAHISDIHIGRMYVPWKKLAWILDNEKPDIVVMTGDYCENIKEIPLFLDFMNTLNLKNNCFLCYGNHDLNIKKNYPIEFENMQVYLKQIGITILDNMSIPIYKNGKSFLLTGFTDYKAGKPDLSLIDGAIKGKYYKTIGISHNPDIMFILPKNGVDYLLCGHLHGGQIWMPFNLEYKFLRSEKSSKLGMIKGLHFFDNIAVYINRGLGNVLFPFRFLSRPEITFYDV